MLLIQRTELKKNVSKMHYKGTFSARDNYYETVRDIITMTHPNLAAPVAPGGSSVSSCSCIKAAVCSSQSQSSEGLFMLAEFCINLFFCAVFLLPVLFVLDGTVAVSCTFNLSES